MPFIGNQPAKVPLTSADITDGIITSAKIADATIANADIANSTINLTTKVTGSLPVANGGTGLTALGSASQVLRVNSGATALEFGTVSSDFVLLATTDASAQATVSFDGFFSSTYKNYKIIISHSYPATNNAVLYARYRRSNADVTASNYMLAGSYGEATSAGNTGAAWGSWNTNYIYLARDGTSNTATNGGFNAVITIHNPLSTASYKFITYNFSQLNASPTMMMGGSSGSVLTDSTAALSGITFYYSSGNITSGNFKLYGIK